MGSSLVSDSAASEFSNYGFPSEELHRQFSSLPYDRALSSKEENSYPIAERSSGRYEPRLSYIQGRSAPTTPSILSRNPSRSHLNTFRNRYVCDRKTKYDMQSTEISRQEKNNNIDNPYYTGFIDAAGSYREYDSSAVVNPTEGDHRDDTLLRAKSSSTLLSFAEAKKGGRQRLPRDLQPLTSKTHGGEKISRSSSNQGNRKSTEQMSDSWLHRAGLAIAAEARESKGQSWLVSRESSTSLATTPIGEPRDLSRDVRASARSSQLTSRFASARQSRHISRRGSGSEDLARLSNDVKNVDAYGKALRQRLLAEVEAASVNQMGPDFVNAKDAEELFADIADDETSVDPDVDDIEVAQLASNAGLGFGLGAWVDWFVGWTLFESENTTDEAEADE